MKRLCYVLMLTAALVLLICSLAFASSHNELPQDIQAYLAGMDATVLDRADLTGHGSDDCWFVMIRTKSGENVLYYFKQKNGVWKEQYHTSDAVPQTQHGVKIEIAESGEEGFAGFAFNKPHLYIGQENDEGEYWEFTVIYELQEGKWMLRRIWSYTGYDNMLIQSDRIVYYENIESSRKVGTVKGVVQRELRYASLSAIPKTLSEAKAKLTVAPDVPESKELTVYPVTFSGKQKYDVYSAPDKKAFRGGNGKARVSTNSWIQVFGTEGDWILIQYSIDANHYRFGYISDKSLPKNANVPELGFLRTEAWAIEDLSVTDDPLYSQSELFTVAENRPVYWLATMGDWAYIESIDGERARGFVPAVSLKVYSDEEQPLMWSDPGTTYLANLLAPQKDIHNEMEARAYAEELCPLMGIGPVPEGRWEINVDPHDESWHCGIFDGNNIELYGVSFLSNGVVQMLSYPDRDSRRYADNFRREGSELDAGRWEQAEGLITEWVEKVSPGILDLVEPMKVNTFVDVGDKLYLFISANPLDSDLNGYINIIAIICEDGHCEIMEYSCYGAG